MSGENNGGGEKNIVTDEVIEAWTEEHDPDTPIADILEDHGVGVTVEDNEEDSDSG